MYDPNDDTDVTSGTTDGAQMETTSAPDVRQGGAGAWGWALSLGRDFF